LYHLSLVANPVNKYCHTSDLYQVADSYPCYLGDKQPLNFQFKVSTEALSVERDRKVVVKTAAMRAENRISSTPMLYNSCLPQSAACHRRPQLGNTGFEVDPC